MISSWRRPSRQWMVLLVAVLCVALGLRLGFWQLGRAAQKTALQRGIEERMSQPTLVWGQVGPSVAANLSTEVAAVVHRRVVLEGEWVAERTRFLDNRQMNGRPGFVVVTPLRLEGGMWVLVQRGWVPRDFLVRERVPRVETPGGRVRIEGRMASAPARLLEFDAKSEPAGSIVQNIDPVQDAIRWQVPLWAGTVLELGASSQGLLRSWSQPATDVHKHYGYAVQWFGLAGLIAILYGWFQLFRPLWKTRRARSVS